MQKSIWRQCKRKRRYKDEHMVNQYRKMFENERGVKLDYYWCPHCNGFHLTSVTTINEKYMAQLLDQQVATVV